MKYQVRFSKAIMVDAGSEEDAIFKASEEIDIYFYEYNAVARDYLNPKAWKLDK